MVEVVMTFPFCLLTIRIVPESTRVRAAELPHGLLPVTGTSFPS
jgi:hypothetical protein